MLRALHAWPREWPEAVPFIFDERTVLNGETFTFTTAAGDLDLVGTSDGRAGTRICKEAKTYELADALMAALGDRHGQRLASRPHCLQEAVRGEIAADLAHLLAEHRIVFDPMPVTVDDRMVDFRTNLFRGHVRAHDLSAEVDNCSTVDCAGNASAAPEMIGLERCAQRTATPRLRRVRFPNLSTTMRERAERRLPAALAADVAGYTRLKAGAGAAWG